MKQSGRLYSPSDVKWENMSEREAKENEKRGDTTEECGLLITFAARWDTDFEGEDDIKDEKRIAVFLWGRLEETLWGRN